MTRQEKRLTPSEMLGLPRRSPGIPNTTGDRVLFSVSTYSFDKHKKSSAIKVLDTHALDGHATLLYDDSSYSEPVPIGADEFLFLKSGDKGTTSLLLGRISQPKTDPTEIHTFDGELSNLKVLALADGALAIALTGLAEPSGKLHNAKTAEKEEPKKKYDTGRIYDKLYVRHWDAYVSENTSAIWYGRLERQDAASGYVLASKGLTNLLADTGLESPVPPFGGASEFDLGPHGIAFVSRDPAYNGAIYTVSSVYFAPLKTYDEPKPLAPPRPIATGALSGYSASPVFSPDGQQLVFTRMLSKQYESDKPQLLLVPDVTKLATKSSESKNESESEVIPFFPTPDHKGAWDANPSSILWSADASELFVTAEREGTTVLYRVPSHPDKAIVAEASGLPEVLVGERRPRNLGRSSSNSSISHDIEATFGQSSLGKNGSVNDVKRLPGGSGKGLLVTTTSLIDNSQYAVWYVDPPSAGRHVSATRAPQISSQTQQGAIFGLSPKSVGEFWSPGGGTDEEPKADYWVHSLVVRPSNFNPAKKYPLAFFIHGGPQGAWTDSWSTRWNPAVFAEQGFVVVAPNPTGSSGYGMALQDGIQNQWGGRPYRDLVNALDYVAEHLPYVDIDRSVALGASYGGYMINWIQGHPLGRRFRALVCHDGVFSTLNQYSSEELFFPLHDFGGPLWENRQGYARWDPATYTGNWETPMLVIHNELDYRLPVTEGLSMFNVLQSRGIPSRLLSFPDENHWVLKPENSLVWHREVLNWIKKYVGIQDVDFEALEKTTAGINISSSDKISVGFGRV